MSTEAIRPSLAAYAERFLGVYTFGRAREFESRGAPTDEVLYVSDRLRDWEREKHAMQSR